VETTAFIAKWSASGAAERANKDQFLLDLCRVLDVSPPSPTTGDFERDTYVFERDAILRHDDGSDTIGKIDLYKAGCFILEAKQGSGAGSKKVGTAKRDTATWNIAMRDAFGQALGYAQTVDAPPPFIITCDLGYCFDLYATFDGSTAYRPFPNARSHRVFLTELPEHLDTFRALFLDPQSLDPSLKAATVTREVARHLAELARALEKAGHDPQLVARFLMRCIFTMFAEDIELIEKDLFTKALRDRWIEHPDLFPREIEALWRTMNTGGELFGHGTLPEFNGGLFAQPSSLRLTREHLQILQLAALSDWRDVEPAIFGTLLERALDPRERHRLGAHFTPRAYVERLVRPTVEEPLRAEWDVVKAQVRQLVTEAKPDVVPVRFGDKKTADPKIIEARSAVSAFHRRLCEIRVLDPACGSGNFLYVALDVFKRLEGEVMLLLRDLGATGELLSLEGVRVTPAQFFGIEVKPWAKEIAELVLWIGYIQWHYRTPGRESLPPAPILRNYGNIECRDAVLAWEGEPELVRDEKTAKPVTRWDGVTFKKSPVTGEDVPDETASVETYHYKDPRKAEWPKADFVVGNPPFIGNKRMRQVLGDGYVEALRAAHDEVPETSDFVMYWWDHAARLLRSGALTRFGLITTNSIRQTFNRKVVQAHLEGKNPVSLVFAVPDHPWVDSTDGAAVRIAMTAAEAGHAREGTRCRIVREMPTEEGDVDVETVSRRGIISAGLAIGVDPLSASPLLANRPLCLQGCKLVQPRNGSGFVLKPSERKALAAADPNLEKFMPAYVVGDDITKQPRQERYVIDFFGCSEDQARNAFPSGFQLLLDRVKPFRDSNKRPTRRDNWWLFGENAPKLRAACRGLTRFIATSEVARHRAFVFLPLPGTLADGSLAAIAHDDAYVLGVLSSSVHLQWALATGGTLEDRPRYQNGPCFDPFPFPACTDVQAARIRKIGEALDAHRKTQQAGHPTLTITGMYGVLQKLRTGEALTDKEKGIHEEGLVSVLKQLHDDLDSAVLGTYTWPTDLSDDEILERLVELNTERAAEETKGQVRWLRPEFQIPRTKKPKVQETLAIDAEEMPVELAGRPQSLPWPERARLPERIAAVRDVVMQPGTWSASAVARRFKGAREPDVVAVLDSLAALGLLVGFDTPDGRRWRVALRVVG
jgi:hypothetical protein